MSLTPELIYRQRRGTARPSVPDPAHDPGIAAKPKLNKGDRVTLTGEVSKLHDDGRVTVRLVGFDDPITTRPEHLSLTSKYKAPKRKRLFDKPD